MNQIAATVFGVPGEAGPKGQTGDPGYPGNAGTTGPKGFRVSNGWAPVLCFLVRCYLSAEVNASIKDWRQYKKAIVTQIGCTVELEMIGFEDIYIIYFPIQPAPHTWELASVQVYGTLMPVTNWIAPVCFREVVS